MGPARPGGGRGAEKGVIAGALALAAALLLFAGLAGFWFWARGQRVAVDEATLCPTSGPAAITAVLVDRSDPLTPQQSRRVRQVLDGLVAEVPVGGRIALYLAEADQFQSLAPAIALCNPGSEANPLYQNPKRMRERYTEQFRKRLDAVRDALLEPSPRKTSPIMESIKAVCIDAFAAAPPQIPLHLLVVSDFLQHSALVSHYRDKQFEVFFKDTKLASVLVDCKGAEVDMLYILRVDKAGRPIVPIRPHQRFWEVYFQKMNGRPTSLETL